MTQAHDWRDPEGLLATLPPPREPIPHGWHDLEWIAQTDRRDAIRIYARLGLHPIAVHGIRDGACTCSRPDCAARGKHPVDVGWQRGALELDVLDAMLLTEWRYNVGLRAGRQPCGRSLVVIDVDGPRELLEPLEREHGAFPETLTARTGRGGLHLFYWLRDGIEMGNRANVVPHVDVRGTGGQVVAPPSRHASGTSYEWINVREPAVLP